MLAELKCSPLAVFTEAAIAVWQKVHKVHRKRQNITFISSLHKANWKELLKGCIIYSNILNVCTYYTEIWVYIAAHGSASLWQAQICTEYHAGWVNAHSTIFHNMPSIIIYILHCNCNTHCIRLIIILLLIQYAIICNIPEQLQCVFRSGKCTGSSLQFQATNACQACYKLAVNRKLPLSANPHAVVTSWTATLHLQHHSID